MPIKKLPDGTIEADTPEELAAYVELTQPRIELHPDFRKVHLETLRTLSDPGENSGAPEEGSKGCGGASPADAGGLLLQQAGAALTELGTPDPNELTEEQLEQWSRQCTEWEAIKNEMLELRPSVTAYQVSLEQRKRMLARGERPLFPPVRDDGRPT